MHALIIFLILVLLVLCRISHSIKESFTAQEESQITTFIKMFGFLTNTIFNTLEPNLKKDETGDYATVGDVYNGTFGYILTNLEGPTGPTGPMGPIGHTGERGPMGERGLTGERGPMGERGLTGESGPMGLTGPMGERGLTGEKGESGLTGGLYSEGGLTRNKNNIPEPISAYTTLFA